MNFRRSQVSLAACSLLMTAALMAGQAQAQCNVTFEKEPNDSVADATANESHIYAPSPGFNGAGTLGAGDTDRWMIRNGGPSGTVHVELWANNYAFSPNGCAAIDVYKCTTTAAKWANCPSANRVHVIESVACQGNQQYPTGGDFSLGHDHLIHIVITPFSGDPRTYALFVSPPCGQQICHF